MIIRGLVLLCPLSLYTAALFRLDVNVEGIVPQGLLLLGPQTLS